MPHQAVPLVFQKAFHGSTELLGISFPQVFQELLGLVQILLQVGFHDCLGIDGKDSVSEDRRWNSKSAPWSAASGFPLTPCRAHQLASSLYVGASVVAKTVK